MRFKFTEVRGEKWFPGAGRGAGALDALPESRVSVLQDGKFCGRMAGTVEQHSEYAEGQDAAQLTRLSWELHAFSIW